MNGFELTEQKINQLVELALRARERAYVPYSHFRVGACLMSKNGTLYCGCNIENAGYPPTNCAERTAIFKAVYEGARQLSAIAVASVSVVRAVGMYSVAFSDERITPVLAGSAPVIFCNTIFSPSCLAI